MIWKTNAIILACILSISCNQKAEKEQKTAVIPESRSSYFSSDHIIESLELMPILDQPNMKVIDFRKKKEYDLGHIDGAIHMWRSDIEDDSFPFSGMMATKETIEILFSKLGINNKDTLVVYDDRGSCDAARLWWVLENYGFQNVKILNGGLESWKAMGGITTLETHETHPTTFILPEDGSMKLFIGKDSLILERTAAPLLLLDTRSQDEYSGKRHKKGAAKAGRIPESILIDWSEAVDYDNNGRFKSYEDLERLYSKLDIKKSHPIVTYCHTGVRSAHTTFVLTELLGYKNVRNYDGSWTEWSHTEQLPIEIDSTTTILQ
ncbi:MAG: sulfurtransferase [Aureisphaera sp.]